MTLTSNTSAEIPGILVCEPEPGHTHLKISYVVLIYRQKQLLYIESSDAEKMPREIKPNLKCFVICL